MRLLRKEGRKVKAPLYSPSTLDTVEVTSFQNVQNPRNSPQLSPCRRGGKRGNKQSRFRSGVFVPMLRDAMIRLMRAFI
jgi:hypothetical protein